MKKSFFHRATVGQTSVNQAKSLYFCAELRSELNQYIGADISFKVQSLNNERRPFNLGPKWEFIDVS
ncbi:MAG TPA: hypothetical protein EYQ50_03980 [Verrucomicrobiales bacterium]|nr:hypothetical protein [Verrucomicrobiales bacterium]